MREVRRDLAAIEYELFIGNSNVTVRKFASEPDYRAAVAAMAQTVITAPGILAPISGPALTA